MTTIRIKIADLKKGPIQIRLSAGDSHKVLLEQDGAKLLEFPDRLFRTNSAVVLPSLEGPSQAGAAGARQVSAVGLVASCLRYLEEHPGLSLLVAGHTDTAGDPGYNRTLSQKRAQTVLSVLTGDSLTFANICKDVRYRVNRDYNQILTWLAETRGWDCRPAAIDDSGNALVVNRFRVEYNRRGPGTSWAPRIEEWGDPNTTEVWQAYFNCYEEFLAEELGVDRDGLAELRKPIQFFVSRGWVGCNEWHPRVAENLDDFPCDSNRRVEVLFFETPTDIAPPTCSADAAACNKKDCHLFNPATCTRVMLPPLASAKPWRATWEPETGPIRSTEAWQAVLSAPGLSTGSPATIRLLQVLADGTEHLVDTIEQTAQADAVLAPIDTWYAPEAVKAAAKGATELPKVRFRFEVEAGGRKKVSQSLSFGDQVDLQFLSNETQEPLADVAYQLVSPWGMLSGKTNADGRVTHSDLPPGGVRVMLNSQRLGG